MGGRSRRRLSERENTNNNPPGPADGPIGSSSNSFKPWREAGRGSLWAAADIGDTSS